MARPQGLRPAAITVALLAVAACAAPDQAPVEASARRFVQALIAGDGAAACDLLTEDARRSVSGATDVPCATAISAVKDDDTTVRAVQVWGDAAQVKIGADVVFLRRLKAGWLVSAAGCQARPSAPYDCLVGG